MTKATEAAMARANSSVGRVWSANVELNQKKAVVRIRNAAINRVLSPLWAKGPVFVRVIEVSEAQRLKGVTMNPSVTVAFPQSMAKIERMNVNNYKKESLVFADLDEAPPPDPEQVSVAVVPSAITDSLAELAARAEALALEFEDAPES